VSVVEDMQYCPWCHERKPVDHHCPAGAVGCTTNPPDGLTCGECGPCIAAMTADLRRREHAYADDPYGSPSDLKNPLEWP
jgi:dissimilatory sulfite reductase (desulfoviridin) alpha/beta subunit